LAISCGFLPPHQLRQLGDVGSDAPGFVAGQQGFAAALPQEARPLALSTLLVRAAVY
jgi:hypothetical protein